MVSDGPTGSDGACNQSGWSTEEIFVQYLKHFVKFVKPSKENKCLLFLDNHETHLSPEALEFAVSNGIVMLSFPPHCSHKLHPLDLAVFNPYLGVVYF